MTETGKIEGVDLSLFQAKLVRDEAKDQPRLSYTVELWPADSGRFLTISVCISSSPQRLSDLLNTVKIALSNEDIDQGIFLLKSDFPKQDLMLA